MSQHFIEICSECTKVIMQCRCPSINKETRYSICKECQKIKDEKSKNESK